MRRKIIYRIQRHWVRLLIAGFYFTIDAVSGIEIDARGIESAPATITRENAGPAIIYELTTTVLLRDNKPPEKRRKFSEDANHATIRTGNSLFDGLYAMALAEAVENSVSEISDGAYADGKPFQLEAFQTGESWKYVWTRDLSYSVHLALAQFDPQRSMQSLLFKTSPLKPTVRGGRASQIIQDTGSGGSYPVSSDRVVWALGANETLKNLPAPQRQEFLNKIYPILCDTIEQDRHIVFDPADGLYRGEQSFLDWREQTYPSRVRDNVLPIAMSKALSVNAANYFLLRSTADYARLLDRAEEASRYADWADALRDAINRGFYDKKAGLYSTYLYSEDGGPGIRVARYDLLGESLAILLGVADEQQAASIIRNYPVGPYGPSVIWPQEKAEPIYHNQAIWPFVTAYWIKAAQKAGNAAAVDAGIQSLEQLAATNLSNMENFDFITGLPEVNHGSRRGPVINSRRQLWSVAGYLSMVQDVVFGLKTTWDGIGFRPFITAKLRNETFRLSDTLELRNFAYLGTYNTVLIHLPPAGSFSQGMCELDHVALNGKPLEGDFTKANALQSQNRWEIFLHVPLQSRAEQSVKNADVSNDAEVFTPTQPEWENIGQGGLTLENGSVVLNYRRGDPESVAFNIYRDGKLFVEKIQETSWTDTHSGSDLERVHTYAVAAVDLKSGNVSHPTSSRSYAVETVDIPAKEMTNRGGNLVAKHHFENWGKPGDELVTKPFAVKRSGRYTVRAEFSNGFGTIQTGVTCAVKKLEVCEADSKQVIAAGYLIMPQSGDWKQYDWSNLVSADLKSKINYTARLSEDEYSRNMSYLKNNARYTAGPGGGDESSNYVNIAGLKVFYSESTVVSAKVRSALQLDSSTAGRNFVK